MHLLHRCLDSYSACSTIWEASDRSHIYSAEWQWPKKITASLKNNYFNSQEEEWVLQQMAAPQSPDLNIIKSVWDYMRRLPQSTEELWLSSQRCQYDLSFFCCLNFVWNWNKDYSWNCFLKHPSAWCLCVHDRAVTTLSKSWQRSNNHLYVWSFACSSASVSDYWMGEST